MDDDTTPHDPQPDQDPALEAPGSTNQHAGDDFWLDEPTNRTRRGGSNTGRNWVVAAVGAVAIAAAAAVGVNAVGSSSSASTAAAGVTGRGGPPAGQGTVGTISSVNGSTISLKALNGKTTTVQTSGSTTVTEAVSGSLTDIHVGDHILVMGSGTSTAVTAQRITDNGSNSIAARPGGSGNSGGPPSGGGQPPSGSSGAPGGRGGPPAGGGYADGTVTAVNGATLTVQSANGSTITVTTSSATTVLVTKPGTVSDLKVGEAIMWRGKTSDGTTTATDIREGSFGPPPGGNGPGGPSGAS